MKIRDNPGIIDVNKDEEIYVNGVLVPGSNFPTLFANMTARRANLNQPGIGEFLSALRQLGVRNDKLSGRELRKMYGSTPVRGPGKLAWRLFVSRRLQQQDNGNVRWRRRKMRTERSLRPHLQRLIAPFSAADQV